MYLQPLYGKCAYFCHGESEGISDRIFKEDICLSSGSNMYEDEQQLVINFI